MEELWAILGSRFDLNVVILFNFGIWLFFDVTHWKPKGVLKGIVSILIGSILSVGYVYFYDSILSSGEEDVVNVPNVVNSFLLSSFLYSVLLKYVFAYITDNKALIAKAIMNWVKKKLGF